MLGLMNFSHPAPRWSVRDAEAVARDHYSLVVRAKPLASHLDQNFLVEGTVRRAVLKIANAAADPASVDMQLAALRHLTSDVESPGVKQLYRLWQVALRFV